VDLCSPFGVLYVFMILAPYCDVHCDKTMEQELPTLPEHLSSTPVFSAVRVTRSLVLYVCFVDRCLIFCTFSFGIVLSVLLRYTDSGWPFGIFKLFFLLLVFTTCCL
jgi:hypothetical protein